MATTRVYCWRSSSASANRNGNSSSRQKSCDRPEEAGDALAAAGHVGDAAAVTPPGRGEEPDGGEAIGGQVQQAVPVGLLGVDEPVGVVEEEQILTLDVEHQRLGVGCLGTEHSGVEQAVEQEAGIGGLRCDTGDARDVHMSATRAVDEVEVQKDRLVVPAQPGRQPMFPVLPPEGLGPLRVGGAVHLVAGQRRDEHLGLEAGGRAPARPPMSPPAARRRPRGTRRSRSGPPRGGHGPGTRRRRSAPDPGRARGRWVATTSSSCRNWPGATPTQNSSGVASSVPMTRPTAFSPLGRLRPCWSHAANVRDRL